MSDSLQPYGPWPTRLPIKGILWARILEWLPCSSPGHLLPPETQPAFLISSALVGRFFTSSPTSWKTQKPDLEINPFQVYKLPSSLSLPVTHIFHLGNLHVGKVSMKNLLCEFYSNNIMLVRFYFCAALLSALLSPLFSLREHLVILKSMKNSTEVTDFILLGLTDDPQLQAPLFAIFSFVYLTTLIGNLGVIMLILLDSSLHTPVYFSSVTCLWWTFVTPPLSLQK